MKESKRRPQHRPAGATWHGTACSGRDRSQLLHFQLLEALMQPLGLPARVQNRLMPACLGLPRADLAPARNT